MARNAAGTYTLPTGNPVVSGTTVASAWGNNTLNDIATELTDSLDRSGKGGMLAPITTPDGTVNAPAHTFTNETGSGWFRNAVNDIRLAVNQVARFISNATGISLISATVDGASAVGHVLDTTAALGNATAKILSVRNATVEKLAVDPNGALLGPAAGAAFVAKGTSADGASAVGVALDSTVALANATAKLVSIRNGGTEKSYADKNGQWNRGALPTVGQQVSSSSGGFTTTSGTLTDVTNLTVTITTTGRPVVLALQSDGTANNSGVSCSASANSALSLLALLRGASVISRTLYGIEGVTVGTTLTAHSPPGIIFLDLPTAGTYTYKIQAASSPGTTVTTLVSYLVLTAYEL